VDRGLGGSAPPDVDASAALGTACWGTGKRSKSPAHARAAAARFLESSCATLQPQARHSGAWNSCLMQLLTESCHKRSQAGAGAGLPQDHRRRSERHHFLDSFAISDPYASAGLEVPEHDGRIRRDGRRPIVIRVQRAGAKQCALCARRWGWGDELRGRSGGITNTQHATPNTPAQTTAPAAR